MDVYLVVGSVVLVIAIIGIVIEVNLLRPRKRRKKPAVAPPRRTVHVEKLMLSAFAGPRAYYDDCFSDFQCLASIRR